jgi:uncharacterized protein
MFAACVNGGGRGALAEIGTGAKPGVNRLSAQDRLARYSWAAALAAIVLFAGYYVISSRTAAEPVSLIVGAGPRSSDSYALMREVADVVNRGSKTIRLSVRETRDPSQSVSLLNHHDVSLAVIRADTPLASDVQMVSLLYPDYFQMMVAGDSPAYDFRDIKGLRIAVPEFGTDALRSFFTVADHYDLKFENISWKTAPFEQARKGLISGLYDGIFTVRSLRDPSLVALFEDAQLRGKALRYLPITQAEAMALKRPFLRPGRIPAGAFTGAANVPSTDTPTAVVDRILVARADVPADAVRELTSFLFDHRLDLIIRFPLAASIKQPEIGQGLTTALHAGARAYYDREKPSYFQKHSDEAALGLTLAAMLGSALLALRARFSKKQKNRADKYNHQLLALSDRIASSTDAAGIDAIRDEHNRILRAIVIALDTDEITDEGFQSFSLLWESVREMLNEKRQEFARD